MRILPFLREGNGFRSTSFDCVLGLGKAESSICVRSVLWPLPSFGQCFEQKTNTFILPFRVSGIRGNRLKGTIFRALHSGGLQGPKGYEIAVALSVANVSRK